MNAFKKKSSENIVSIHADDRSLGAQIRKAGGKNDMTDTLSDVSSRQAILEAAANMMALKGYSGTSISMICKAAGCPASSLYWHFSSKENLFAEIVKEKADYFFRELTPQMVQNEQFAEMDIDTLAERVGTVLQSDPLFLRFLLLLGLERKDMPDGARNTIVEVRRAARQWWLGLLEQRFRDRGPTVAKLIAEEYADFGRSLIDGAFFAWEFGDGSDLRKAFRQLMVLFAALNEKIAAEESKNGDSAQTDVP